MSRYLDKTPEKAWKILDKTAGRCHTCRKRRSFCNHGRIGAHGAWEIDHSRPKALGGSDHLNNLYAACIPCNRFKGIYTSRAVRRYHGYTRAPMSRERKEELLESRTVFGIVAGLLLGRVAAQPPATVLVLAVLGGWIGYDSTPSNA